MSTHNFDIEALSSETFNIKHEFIGLNPFEMNLHSEYEVESNQLGMSDSQFSNIQDSAGVIYKIELGRSTFCIKAIAARDLTSSLLKIKQDFRDDSFLKLNIKENDNLDQIDFFPTQSFENAEVIVDQVSNRRFPYIEDMLCNLSDPGFSWWLNVEIDKLSIHFKSYGINRQEDLIKLGPIGDSSIAQSRFSQMFGLERASYLCDFNYDGKSFVVESHYGMTERMELLRNCLVDGILPENYLELFSSNMRERTLGLFLGELAAIRQFWLIIESKTSSKEAII